MSNNIILYTSVIQVCVWDSDEDTDVSALLKAWLRREQVENRDNLENWINDYFQRALDWVLTQVHTHTHLKWSYKVTYVFLCLYHSVCLTCSLSRGSVW